MKTAILALALATAAFGQEDNSTNSSSMSLTAVLGANPQLSSLLGLLQPYQQNFASLNNITLLAPNNDAISQFLNSSTGAAVGTQPALVQAILKYVISVAGLSFDTDVITSATMSCKATIQTSPTPPSSQRSSGWAHTPTLQAVRESWPFQA